MYLGVKKATVVNTVVNISLFLFLVIIYEDKIGFFKQFKIFMLISMYYILNVYNMEKGRYTLNDFVISLIPNLVLFLVGFRIYIFDNELVLFWASFVMQNLSKIILYKLYAKETRVLIVGNSEFNGQLREIIGNRTYLHIVDEIEKNEVFKIPEVIVKNNVDKIVITETINDEKTSMILLNQKLDGIEIYDYFDFYEELEEKVPVKSIDENWILFGRGYKLLHRNFNVKAKNLLDYTLAIIVVILALPVMILSAIIIKIDSKGPIFYKIVMLECKNHPYLLEFYKKYGFQVIDKNYEKNELFQLIRIFNEEEIN